MANEICIFASIDEINGIIHSKYIMAITRVVYIVFFFMSGVSLKAANSSFQKCIASMENVIVKLDAFIVWCKGQIL